MLPAWQINRLYHVARLVHGDLSEYNILVCPTKSKSTAVSSKVDEEDQKKENSKDTTTATVFQIILIDFGQAVERGHPQAKGLLHRDLLRVQEFFKKQGVSVLDLDDCVKFVLEPCRYGIDLDVDVDVADDAEKEEKQTDREDVILKSPQLESSNEDLLNSETELEPIQKESLGDDGEAEKVTNDDEPSVDQELNEDTWRHSIPGWDDEKDYDRLVDLIRVQAKP